LYKIINAGGAV